MLQAAAEQAQFNPPLIRIDLSVGHKDLNQYHWSAVDLERQSRDFPIEQPKWAEP